jgi:hypothetical protein
MSAYKKTAKIAGIFFLMQGIAAVLINQVLAGPVVFAPDFLVNVSANTTQMIIALLISLISGALGVGIAAMLLPVLKQHNKSIAYWYFGLSVVQFVFIALNDTSRLSILALSEEYVRAGTPDADHFLVIGHLFHAHYWWTHYLMMLFSCLVLPLFYYVLYQSKLIPRFISVWGLLGTVFLLITVLLAIFDKGVIMLLFLPIGLNQTFLAIWLIVKGFNPSAVTSGYARTEVMYS